MFKWLEKYFTFSRMERNAIVALLILAFGVLLVPRIYFFFKPVEHISNATHEHELDVFLNGNKTLSANEELPDTLTIGKDSVGTVPDSAASAKKVRRLTGYFYFDPNKIGVEDWMRLGFTEKQAEGIEKYKAKGGKFYRPQDLMRLYAMDEEHYYKLKPWVRIDVSALPKRNYDRY